MFKCISVLIFSIFMSSPVISQVDTLHLVKTAGIQTPQPIWGFYLSDINSDDFQDIITYSENHIYVIDGASQSLYWSSPEIPMPEKIVFADIDRDATQDIIAKCGSNIIVMEPPSQFIYWTSPVIDYTYIDFDIGDRNRDLFPDIIIVRKEPFYRTGNENNLDTVWVSAYNGPNYNEEQTIILRVPNHDYYSDLMQSRYTHNEYPTKIVIDDFTSDSSEAKILLFTNLDESVIWHGFYSSWTEAGYVKFLRGSNLGNLGTEPQGRNYLCSTVQIDGDNYLVSVSSNSFGVLTRDNEERYDDANYYRGGNQVRIDSLNYYHGTTDNFNIAGTLISEINNGQEGLELCFGGMLSEFSSNKLVQRSIESGEQIWQRNLSSNIDTLLFKYSGPPYSHPQIVLMFENDIYYRFYDGVTGNPTGIYNPDYYFISRIADLDNDGIDEIISTANDSICIFTLARTGIDDYPFTPSSDIQLSAYPNPFNNNVNIEYNLSKGRNVEIAIYNLSGQMVNRFDCGYQPFGKQRITWNAGRMSSGIYFCKISGGEYSSTTRLILMK